MDLGLLFIEEAHQFVVLFDGFKRLDEHGLAAGRRAVSHALHAAALLDLDRNDEAVSADGDQFVLHGAVVGEAAQIRLERSLDSAALALDVAADAGQLGRGVVVKRAVRQDLVVKIAEQLVKVSDLLRQLADRLPLIVNGRRGIERGSAPL